MGLWASKIARALGTVLPFVICACPAFPRWVSAGPFGGNAEVIAAAPGDPNLLLAGTKNANLFISTDAGATWNSLAFPRQYGAMLHTLVIDPGDSKTIYAAIADDSGAGLYHSGDRGRSWLPVPGFAGQEVFGLAIWSGDSKVMAVGLRDGVRLTRDGGKTWKQISPANNIGLQPVVSLSFDPRSADTIYAGTPRLPWKTVDGGENWTMAAEGISTDSDILTVRVDPSSPDRVFIGACSGFWASRNGGDSWAKMNGIPSSSRRTYAFAQDREDPELIFAGTSRGLYRTTDGGVEWKKMAEHEIKSLAISGGALYVATGDQGLFKSTDRGETLEPINQGFTSRTLSRVAERGEQLYTSTSYEGEAGGIFASSDAGLHWRHVNSPQGIGNEDIVSVVRGAKGGLLAVTRSAVFLSKDGGENWSRSKVAFKAPIQSLCALGSSVMLSTQSGLYRTRDEGVTWALALDAPGSRALVYAGSAVALLRDRMLISKDDGATWESRHLPFFTEVSDIATAGDVILAASSRGVFRSLDGGQTWQAAASGIPAASVSAVAVDPDSGRAYAFEYGHLYESRDTGANWARFDEEGLEGAFVHHFAVAGQGLRHLLALTNTRGIFVRDFDSGPVPASHASTIDLFRKDVHVPNPQNKKTPAS